MALAIAATSGLGPQPSIDVTATGVTGSSVTVWRNWAGRRVELRGVKSAPALAGTMAWTDYEAPLDVAVTYQITVRSISGAILGSAQSSSVTITSPMPWLSDPLAPAVATPISRMIMPSAAEQLFERESVVALPIGSRLPVSISDVEREASGVALVFSVSDATELEAIRAVLRSASPFLLRVPAAEGTLLPALAYCHAKAVQLLRPGNAMPLYRIAMSVTLVREQAAHVMVPPRTYARLLAEATDYADLLGQRQNYLGVLRGGGS